jgi:fructokinase
VETSRPILCLGEAIVDLVCERRLAGGEPAESLIPHPGGALANVSVAIARKGAPAAMVGGVGADEWGLWLRQGLRHEGVETAGLPTVEGVDTPVAIVRFDLDGEPRFQVYGQGIGPTMEAAVGPLEKMLPDSQGLVVGSNTMVGRLESEVTRNAVELAARHDIPVLLDPNYRSGRWDDHRKAAAVCRELSASAAVIKLNRIEAELITGIGDPAPAARALAARGPGLVVVTDGSGPIHTAGAVEFEVTPPIAEVVSTMGAGDAFTGALTAGLAAVGWDFSRAGELIEEAAAAATGVCGHWGAQG